MPRKPLEELTPSYRRRVIAANEKYRAQYGLPEGAEAPRQLARGHKPQEHITRRERAIARGEQPFSSADYAFLAKQRDRMPPTLRIVGRRLDGQPVFANETPTQRFDRAKEAYRKLSREDRDELRHRQQAMQHRYERAVEQGESGDYEDEDFYDDFYDQDDDITPLKFYH